MRIDPADVDFDDAPEDDDAPAAAEGEAGVWACAFCDVTNNPASETHCSYCGSQR